GDDEGGALDGLTGGRFSRPHSGSHERGGAQIRCRCGPQPRRAAANSAGNTTIINSIAWDLEDNTALLADARDRAIADARAKAEQYAKAAGRSLGAVVSISESTMAPPQPYAYAAAEAQDRADGAVPLA